MKTILIADDSSVSRNIMENIISETGHQMIFAKDGNETIEIINNKQCDMAIVDLLMPNKDGIEVLKYLKVNKIKIPVIILTADIQKTTREECEKLGCADFIQKPIKSENILRAVKKILG